MKLACCFEQSTMHELLYNSILSVVAVCVAVLHQLPKDAAPHVCAWSVGQNGTPAKL